MIKTVRKLAFHSKECADTVISSVHDQMMAELTAATLLTALRKVIQVFIVYDLIETC